MLEPGVELDRWPCAFEEDMEFSRKTVVGKMREVTHTLRSWWGTTKLAGSKQYKDNGRLDLLNVVKGGISSA
jgi:hypothetical protein